MPPPRVFTIVCACTALLIAIAWVITQLYSFQQGLGFVFKLGINSECSSLSTYLTTNGIVFILGLLIFTIPLVMQWVADYHKMKTPPTWRQLFFASHHHITVQNARFPHGRSHGLYFATSANSTMQSPPPIISLQPPVVTHYHALAILPTTLPHHKTPPPPLPPRPPTRRLWTKHLQHAEWLPPRSTCAQIFGEKTVFSVEPRDGVGFGFFAHNNDGNGNDHDEHYNIPSPLPTGSQHGVADDSSEDGSGDDDDETTDNENDDNGNNNNSTTPTTTPPALRHRRRTIKHSQVQQSPPSSPQIAPKINTKPPPTLPKLKITGDELKEKYRQLAYNYAYSDSIYSLPPPHYYHPPSFHKLVQQSRKAVAALVFYSFGWLFTMTYDLYAMASSSSSTAPKIIDCPLELYEAVRIVVLLNWLLPVCFILCLAAMGYSLDGRC